jgi:hypothetical protein
MGIRVVRLNGQPLSLWFSLERFGGYAAGIATGVLGFLQVFWHRTGRASTTAWRARWLFAPEMR